MWGYVCHTETHWIHTSTKFVGPSTDHSETTLCSSVTNMTDLIAIQTSHIVLTITGEKLSLSITTEKYTVVFLRHELSTRIFMMSCTMMSNGVVLMFLSFYSWVQLIFPTSLTLNIFPTSLTLNINKITRNLSCPLLCTQIHAYLASSANLNTIWNETLCNLNKL